MIEKLYTVEEVAELASVTGRTIRNYLKSGRLIGRKIGGQWRFPENEVQLLLTGGAPPVPAAAVPPAEAPRPDGEQPRVPPYKAPSVAALPDVPGEGEQDRAEIDDAQAEPPPRCDAYAAQRYTAEPAPLPAPAPPAQTQAAPAAAPHNTAPAVPEIPAAAPAAPQSAPPAEAQTAGAAPQGPAAPAQNFAPPPAFYPPGYMPYAPGVAAPGGGYAQMPYYPYPFPYPFMQPIPPVYAQPFPVAAAPAAVPVPEPQPAPAEEHIAEPEDPAPEQEPPAAGEAAPPAEEQPAGEAPPEEESAAEATPPAEEQPPAEPQPKAPAETDSPAPAEAGRPAPSMPELSEVGRRAAKFISQVHDCSHGPQVCAVVDLYQSLLTARATANRLADIADEESALGTPCQSFVEFDDRYFVSRHTLLGSSAFLLRCLKLIG